MKHVDVKQLGASTKSLILDDSALPSEAYLMESALFDYTQVVRRSETFGFKRYLKALYRGELADRKRHGFGVMLYEGSERVYEGTWVDDQRQGRGYERYKNGATYIGDFADNKPSG